MSESITKADLQEFGRSIKTDLKEAFRDELRETKRDLIDHFNKSQVMQNERMDKMDMRFDGIEEGIKDIKEKVETLGEDMERVKVAVLDLMTTDRHIHNLVQELQRNGIAIDPERVFAT